MRVRLSVPAQLVCGFLLTSCGPALIGAGLSSGGGGGSPPDRTPPPAPASVDRRAAADGSLTIGWSAVTDSDPPSGSGEISSGTDHYVVDLRPRGNAVDVVVPEVPAGGNLEVQVSGVSPCATYDLDVRAVDRRGNVGAVATATVRTTCGPTGALGNATSTQLAQDPAAVAFADLDLDGRVDVVAAAADGTTRVLLAVGDGTFVANPAQASFAIGATPTALVCADFDLDGTIDLAAACADGAVRIFLGTGVRSSGRADVADGAFPVTPTSVVTVGTGPVACVAADFDRDGRPDLAVANHGSGTISILRNLGAGAFGAQAAVATGTGPTSLAVADFDRDGRIDLVAAHDSEATLRVFLQQSMALTFAQVAAPAMPSAAGKGVVVAGDFDADGVVDLAAAFAGDAQLGVILGASPARGQWSAKSVTTTSGITSTGTLLVADLDRDRVLDLICTDSTAGRFGVFRGNAVSSGSLGRRGLGDGSFAELVSRTTTGSTIALDVSDVTSDHQEDVVVVTAAPAQILTFPSLGAAQVGSGAFASPSATPTPTGINPGFIQTADLDHDGILDFIFADFANDSIDFAWGGGSDGRNDGTFQLDSFTRGASAVDPRWLAIADFDGDGKLDVVSANKNQSGGVGGKAVISYFRGTGIRNPPLEAPQVIGLPLAVGAVDDLASCVVAADFNRDGLPDLAITTLGDESHFQSHNTSFSGQVYVLLNRGAGPGAMPFDLAAGNPRVKAFKTNLDPHEFFGALVASDFDHDGAMDIAAVDSWRHRVFTLWGNPQGKINFDPGVLGPDPIADSRPGTLVTLGQDTTLPWTGLVHPNHIASADFDRDGIADLAIACFGTPSSGVRLNGGIAHLHGRIDAGVFSWEVMPSIVTTLDPTWVGLDPSVTPQRSWARVEFGDFDGDGDLDIVAGGISVTTGSPPVPPIEQHGITVFLNRLGTARGSAATFGPSVGRPDSFVPYSGFTIALLVFDHDSSGSPDIYSLGGSRYTLFDSVPR